MANSGPDTNGSQFFINFADTPWLKGHHTCFGIIFNLGKVIEGEEYVMSLDAYGT